MNIKAASERLAVPKETLRYWESCGLLPPIPRNASGYREYGEAEIKWGLFIKAMRKAGMSVERLVNFVTIYREHQDSRAAQKSLLQEQYDALLQQRTELDRTLNYLAYKLDHFEDHVLPFLEEEDYYHLRKQSDRRD
ncbi:MerR family transcriptional regulator [Limosilactobacillus ingluviei]|uniref:MerR family transcriptional regulator n=1 Tax=Limosilactobacillus ingluviei TaxID=148604 RepID=UPI0002D5B5C5|nr:MerR family transcriptional regulator [Limosilactobacillus ingluviei]